MSLLELQPELGASLLRDAALGNVPPAQLFIGPAGAGKVEAAMAQARALNCEAEDVEARPCGACSSCRRMLSGNHPNLRVLYPVPSPRAGLNEEKSREELETSIAEVLEARRAATLFAYDPDKLWPGKKASLQLDLVRSVRRELSYSLGEGRARVVVLAEAHLLTPEAANALLKILEEPGPGTHWILTTSRPNRILPTVRSRCRSVEFDPVGLDILSEFLQRRLKADAALARTAAALGQGSPALAMGFLNAGAGILTDRDHALELWKLAQTAQWPRLQREVESLRFRCYRERGLASRILRFWLLWVRDLLLVKAHLPESNVANLDKLEGLRKAAEQIPWDTLSARYEVIEDCIGAEALNVAPEVLLYSALTRLAETRNTGSG